MKVYNLSNSNTRNRNVVFKGRNPEEYIYSSFNPFYKNYSPKVQNNDLKILYQRFLPIVTRFKNKFLRLFNK